MSSLNVFLMSVDELKEFLDERPLISLRGLSLEAGFSDSYLHKLLKKEIVFTPQAVEKILPVIKKYGYVKKNN